MHASPGVAAEVCDVGSELPAARRVSDDLVAEQRTDPLVHLYAAADMPLTQRRLDEESVLLRDPARSMSPASQRDSMSSMPAVATAHGRPPGPRRWRRDACGRADRPGPRLRPRQALPGAGRSGPAGWQWQHPQLRAPPGARHPSHIYTSRRGTPNFQLVGRGNLGFSAEVPGPAIPIDPGDVGGGEVAQCQPPGRDRCRSITSVRPMRSMACGSIGSRGRPSGGRGVGGGGGGGGETVRGGRDDPQAQRAEMDSSRTAPTLCPDHRPAILRSPRVALSLDLRHSVGRRARGPGP